MRKIKIIFSLIFVACCLLFGCASNSGLVLHPTGFDKHRGSRDYHFANKMVGFDFYFLKSDAELAVADLTSVFIENRTSLPMAVTMTREQNKRIFTEIVSPRSQAVVSIVLPYDEWLTLWVDTGRPYFAHLKLMSH